MHNHGTLWVTSGPSGAGKTSLLNIVLASCPDCTFSVSATTRKARQVEKEGVDYFFVSQQDFLNMVENNEFLEWAEVHDNLYGTPKKPVEKELKKGKDVILDVDVQGGLKIKKLNRPDAVMVFIAPPGLAEMERRLRQRGTEDENKIQERINTARWELSKIQEYQYLVINDDQQKAADCFKAIMIAKKCEAANFSQLKF